MYTIKRILSIALFSTLLMTVSACSPEVGSEQWCKAMDGKAKADWTVNDATDYAKHCILK